MKQGREYGLHNDLMERKALACIIRDPKAMAEGFTQLSEKHFYEPQTRSIYKTAKKIYNDQGKLTWTLLQRELFKVVDDKGIEQVTNTIEQYMESYSVLDDWESIKQTLHEQHNLRAIRESTLEAQAIIEDKNLSYDDKVKKCQEVLFRQIKENASASAEHISNATEKFATEYALRRAGKKEHGTFTSIAPLNHRCGGLKNGRLHILAGRPAMGKTALALQVNKDVATTKKDGVALMFSLEMYEDDLAERLAIMEMGVDSKYFTNDDYLLDEDRPPALDEALNNALKRVKGMNLYVCYKRGLSVDEIIAISRASALEHGKVNLITIDYLQLIDRNSRDEVAELGRIVRKLRDLAGELGCPMLLLSQLNRGVEMRENKRPSISDLRASGEIEEAADIVLLMYRDEYYGKDEASPKVKNVLELIFGKVRQGETGVDYIEFNPASMSFKPLEKDRLIAYKEAVEESKGKPVREWEPPREEVNGYPVSIYKQLKEAGVIVS